MQINYALHCVSGWYSKLQIGVQKTILMLFIKLLLLLAQEPYHKLKTDVDTYHLIL